METKVAIIGVIVEDTKSVAQLNAILHEYGDHIIGRMGLPDRNRKFNLISIALDAPAGVVEALSEKLERLQGVSVNALYAKKPNA